LRKKIIQILKFLAFLIIGITLLWLAFRNVNFKSLANSLKEANYLWLVLSVLFGFFAFLSRARRWMILINPLSYKPSFWHTFHGMMTGYLANLALPRIGEITRCITLGKKENIPVDQLFGTVVIERAIDFITLMFILFIMVITGSAKINEFLKLSIFIPLRDKVFNAFGFAWLIWVILILAAGVSLFILLRYRKNLRRFRFFARMFDVARGIINGFKSILTLERKWEFIFHTIIIWVNYTLMTWVAVFCIHSTSHLTLWDAVFLLVIGGLAMSAPVQSGLGAFHYIISRGLAFVQGVKLEDGLAYALLTHESQLIFVVIAGTLSFFLMFGRRHKEEIHPTPPKEG
jgi:glycosyltransferase 2 family protein